MPKTCKADGCKWNVFSNGYCKVHQDQRTDAKWLRTLEKQKAKRDEPKKAIAKMSESYAAETAKYNKRVKEWKLEDANKFCAYPGCSMPTEDCHHSGLRGILINREEFWVPLCRAHHDLCKSKPKLATALNLIFSRTKSMKYDS